MAEESNPHTGGLSRHAFVGGAGNDGVLGLEGPAETTGEDDGASDGSGVESATDADTLAAAVTVAERGTTVFRSDCASDSPETPGPVAYCLPDTEPDAGRAVDSVSSSTSFLCGTFETLDERAGSESRISANE